MKQVLMVPVLLAVVGAMVLLGCDPSSGKPEDREVDPDPVETLVVEPTDFTDTFEVLGTAEPEESVEVASEFPGDVLDVNVEEGDEVNRGDLLFRIDTETDEAGREVLKTQVDAAKRELERLERLNEEGLATQQQVDNARTDLERAERDLRQSDVSIGRHRVRSPVDGRVAMRMVDAGEFASAGVPLIEIVQFDTVVVYAQVPESEIRYVDTDDTTELEVDIPALDETYTGEIRRVALRPSASTRTYTVEVHVDNEDQAIRPGMRARTHFQRDHYDDVLLIPRDSILEGFDGREVMVVDGDEETGRAEVRSITTGPGTRNDVVVFSGLEPGERLVLRGHRGLIADAKVEVVEEHRQGDDKEDRQ